MVKITISFNSFTSLQVFNVGVIITIFIWSDVREKSVKIYILSKNCVYLQEKYKLMLL